MDEAFYSECATAFQEEFVRTMRDAAFEDPLFSKMLRVAYDHGVSVVAQAGEWVDHSEFTATTTSLTMPFGMLESGDVTHFIRLLDEGAKQMREQIGRHFVRRLDDTTERTGNVVDGQGKPLTAELLCRMLEKMEISFDRAGRIQMPTFVFAPEMEDSIRRLLEDRGTQLRLNAVYVSKWFDRYKL